MREYWVEKLGYSGTKRYSSGADEKGVPEGARRSDFNGRSSVLEFLATKK